MKSAIQTLTQHPDIYLGNAADAAQSPIERLPLGVKALDAALAGGIPSAGLSRIRCHQGSGELQLLHPVFAAQRNTGKKVIWLYRHQSINPVWLAKHQLLTDSWLLSPANEQDALWACEQCIRSQACSLIVYSYASLNAKAARRLQVLSKQYQCLLLNIDYNLQTFMSLPVNVDCELYYKDTQWYITLHRVVGSWPKSDIPICNPLPASNDAIITAMRETQSASVSTLTGS